jgi:capsular exopolysaccharide synthesis family protein
MTKKKINRIHNYAGKLITSKNSKSPISEAFRTIRTNIEFSSIDHKIKTILVTSTEPGEGKSVTVANLGVTMAMAGKRVLVIDSDLRNPTIHKIYEITNDDGLTNLLVNPDIKPTDILVSPYPNLYFLASGPLPPNPAELLGSQKIHQLFDTLKNEFDLILVDSPPVLAVADASILASYLDGVILVAASGQVSKDHILSARDQLQKVKANILGVILNKVPEGSGSYYNYYYYGSTSSNKNQ